MDKYKIVHGEYKASGPPLEIQGPVDERYENQLVNLVCKTTLLRTHTQEALPALVKLVGDERAARILRKMKSRSEAETNKLKQENDHLQKENERLQKENKRLKKENDQLLSMVPVNKNPFLPIDQGAEKSQPKGDEWYPDL